MAEPHTLAHALDPTLCACDRSARLAACIICGRIEVEKTDEARADDWDTCGRPCWSRLLALQRAALITTSVAGTVDVRLCLLLAWLGALLLLLISTC